MTQKYSKENPIKISLIEDDFIIRKGFEDLLGHEENFKIIFNHSPLKRTKFAGIKRNLKFIQTS